MAKGNTTRGCRKHEGARVSVLWVSDETESKRQGGSHPRSEVDYRHHHSLQGKTSRGEVGREEAAARTQERLFGESRR